MSESLYFRPSRYVAGGKADTKEAGQTQSSVKAARDSGQPARDLDQPSKVQSGQAFDQNFGQVRASSDDTIVPEFRRTTTRADLLDAVYASCPSLSRNQARDIFETALEEVSGALTRGESVKLRAFGLFTVREKRERIGRNPRTGQEVPIKPRRVLTFKASPVLLDHVNGRELGKAEKDDH